ncbi:MAG: TlpA family protein disulfide reductase [Candidatus Aminicenantes bacterium]|nr:MAG: TlpA family protein disulfide reductase [Candidatus Aminicenantes bacterium]
MKKIIVLCLIVSLLVIHLGANRADTGKGNKELMQKIYRLYSEQQYLKALQLTEQSLKIVGPSNELLQMKYNILVKLKRYDEALAFIQKEIKTSGESEELLSAQYNILFLQGKLTEALKVALRKDKITKKKSPWDCINIMHVYLRMGSRNDALDWLQEAVTRGFISYRILEDKKYEPLQSDKRFYRIIENIKLSIGLGYPAKNFRVKLLTGEDFTLANQRGKVVLIYFWATWCEPCKNEMPYLDQVYQQFKDKGVEIVSISLDSNLDRTKEYIKQTKLQWKHSCSGQVWQDDTVKRYGVNSVPSLWLVDQKGVLRSFDIKGEELRRVIAYLLATRHDGAHAFARK